jgi:hypothetical protein
MREHDPDVVGLSIMTFQRRTALRLIRRIRAIKPTVTVVAGGYDPSLASESYEAPSSGVDFIVRGEGELTFRALLRALADRYTGRGGDLSRIPGLCYRAAPGAGFTHTPSRPVSRLDGDLELPNRAARFLAGYTFLGRPIDIVETSRGCTYDCSFCSIIEMRGRNFHTFDFTRVLADIADARGRGARAIFLVDDNITLNVARFEALCRAIVAAGLNDIHYLVQAMTSSIASHGAMLAPLMWQAGFRYVFLGIENVIDDDLAFLRASAKNAQARGGTAGRECHHPGDRRLAPLWPERGRRHHRRQSRRHARVDRNQSRVRAALRRLALHPAPDAVPGDADDRGLPRRGLIVNERVEEYDGTTGSRADRASRRRRHRVPALARRAVDEGAAPARRAAPLPGVHRPQRPADARAHVPRIDVAVGRGARERAAGVRALQGAARRRARVRAGLRYDPSGCLTCGACSSSWRWRWCSLHSWRLRRCSIPTKGCTPRSRRRWSSAATT